ncbi:hypothetical protein QQF64_014016 [Cirrhinus molitorella]|uniref:Microtubule-actin cross-linking factor 1 n=1 Tax=Cirrhinus molitorella TaxID=172907 RepID=A0ABR3LUF5_9TELE
MRKERVRKRRRRGPEKERAGEKEGYERRGIDSHYRITVSILLLRLPAHPRLCHPACGNGHCRYTPSGEMSSSDEESLSERSCVSERSFRSERSGGSLSPCAHSTAGPKGDTLPWNLSKHERRKRKSQDSVLDPAERAVVRVAGSSKSESLSSLVAMGYLFAFPVPLSFHGYEIGGKRNQKGPKNK